MAVWAVNCCRHEWLQIIVEERTKLVSYFRSLLRFFPFERHVHAQIYFLSCPQSTIFYEHLAHFQYIFINFYVMHLHLVHVY